MCLKKQLLPIVVLSLTGFSSWCTAEIVSTKSLNGITHQFTFDTQAEAVSVFADNQQNIDIFHAGESGRIGQVVLTTENDRSFTVIRVDAVTYVVAQPDDKGHTSLTTIQKPDGGVQNELYNYLLQQPTSFAKAGIDAVTQGKVNAILDAVKTAVPDASVTTGAKNAFVNTLVGQFDPTAVTPTTPTTPVPSSPLGALLNDAAKNTVNRYLKNGVLQGSPAGHIAQMAYYDQTLDLGGVASGHLFNSHTDKTRQSRLAIKTRLSNYNVNNQSVQVYTVAPSYTHELGKDWALLFDAPLTYMDRGGNASTYNASVGMGIRIPMARYRNINWDLIPLGRLSGVNLDCVDSNDLQCADSSFVYSGGAQSNLGISLGSGYSLVAQNQYTYNNVNLLASNATVNFGIPVPVNLSASDTGIHVYRNGVQLIKDLDYTLFGRTVSSRISFADTRFDSGFGSFVDNQQEYGFNVDLRGQASQGNGGRDLRLGISYTDADGVSDAVSGNIGMSF